MLFKECHHAHSALAWSLENCPAAIGLKDLCSHSHNALRHLRSVIQVPLARTRHVVCDTVPYAQFVMGTESQVECGPLLISFGAELLVCSHRFCTICSHSKSDVMTMCGLA